jgi:hypothetical protein
MFINSCFAEVAESLTWCHGEWQVQMAYWRISSSKHWGIAAELAIHIIHGVDSEIASWENFDVIQHA